MLAVTSYPKDYVDDCRALLDAQLAAYRDLVAAIPKGKAEVLDAFVPRFFEDLTLVLDHYFVHRTRAVEGKDGNPLNEVRMLCASIMSNGGVFTADKTIKYTPETSVLGLHFGDRIVLDEAGFVALADAYFTELRRRFT